MRYSVVVNQFGEFWYKEGTETLHREGGPSIELENGNKYWYINGKRHREDGPATECADGTKEWYLNGRHVTESEFNTLMGKHWTDEYDAAAISEGWCISNNSDGRDAIQRMDERAVFPHDEAALAYVKAWAEADSALHQRALDYINRKENT